MTHSRNSSKNEKNYKILMALSSVNERPGEKWKLDTSLKSN